MARTISIYVPIARCFPLQLKRIHLKLDCFPLHPLRLWVGGWMRGWVGDWIVWLIDRLIACLTESGMPLPHCENEVLISETLYDVWAHFTIIFFINSVSTPTFSRSHTNHGASRSSTAVVRLVPGTDLCPYGLQLWSVHWLLSMNCLTIPCLTCRGLVRAFNLWLVHGMDQWRLLSSLRKS